LGSRSYQGLSLDGGALVGDRLGGGIVAGDRPGGGIVAGGGLVRGGWGVAASVPGKGV
jgi:hypothetical protein